MKNGFKSWHCSWEAWVNRVSTIARNGRNQTLALKTAFSVVFQVFSARRRVLCWLQSATSPLGATKSYTLDRVSAYIWILCVRNLIEFCRPAEWDTVGSGSIFLNTHLQLEVSQTSLWYCSWSGQGITYFTLYIFRNLFSHWHEIYIYIFFTFSVKRAKLLTMIPFVKASIYHYRHCRCSYCILVWIALMTLLYSTVP